MRKQIIHFSLFTFTLSMIASCSELKDDDHYSQAESTIANEELKIVEQTSEQYMQSRNDLSSMNELFRQQGIYDELHQKGQLSTLLVVTNDHFAQPAEDVAFITRSHVSDISISPANLENGTRLMMWHGKYVNVTIDSLGLEGNIVDHVLFNNGAVKEVIKTSTGYIYVISDMIQTPTSLRDFIDALPDEYSIFRDMVLASGGKEFDRANSKAIGINEQGNTVYDSVFIYTNTFFDAVDFDMNSESLTATMLLPSNEVVADALADVQSRLEKWQATDANLGHRNANNGNVIWPGCNDSIVKRLQKMDSEDSFFGIELRVNKVPEHLSQLPHIKRLTLHFTGKVELPTWFYDLKIDNLTIYGEMTDEQEAAIWEIFPNAILNSKGVASRSDMPTVPSVEQIQRRQGLSTLPIPTREVTKAKKANKKRVKAGKKISGVVSDEVGPLMGATVCEVDAKGYVVEAVVTDINGVFSMKVKNPQNYLRFSYVGLNTVIVPIDKKEYKVKMEPGRNQFKFKLEPEESQYRFIPINGNI